jgi:hypothetical protein
MQRQDGQRPEGRRRLNRAMVSGLALLGVGAMAGGILSTALSADAATPTTTSTVSGSSTTGGTSSTAAPGGASARSGPPPGGGALSSSGTVTAVGASSVTIQTSTATTTYAVTSSSDIDKNGEAALSDLAVGDAVTFSTVTTNGTTAIDRLHAGNAALDMPQGGPGGALSSSGTVTAVGASSVTIKTSTATTTYAVTSSSDIDKNGEAALSDLAVGDAVTFSTVTTNGTTAIDRLHAGSAALDMPQGAGPGGGPGPGYGAPPSSSSGTSSSSGSGTTGSSV